MYFRYLSITFFIILNFSNCKASFELTQDILSAYSNYINLRPDQADKYLSNNENNGMSIYLENYGDVIRILASQDKKLYEKLEKNENERIKRIKALDKNSPYYLLSQAEIKLQWLMVKMNFGEYWNAIWEAKQVYKLITKNHELFPEFIPNKKILGIFYAYIGSIPEDYAWIIKVLRMKGSVVSGLKYLDELADSNHYLNLEAKIAKIYLQAFLLKQKKEAYEAILKLYSKQPENLLVKYITITICILNNKGKKALQIIKTVKFDSSHIQITLISYIKGDLLLKTGNYLAAIDQFETFLEKYGGSNNIKDACFKIFLCKWFLGQDNAIAYLDKVKEFGESINIKDKYAEKFAYFKSLPNKNITEARFLYDGGVFEIAIGILDKIGQKGLPTKDKVELLYRKARIYHAQERYDKALKMYKRTIKISGKIPHYFAPSAALQAGYIYAGVFGNNEKAKIYLKKVLEYKKHEYKNDLDYSAKTALKKMN